MLPDVDSIGRALAAIKGPMEINTAAPHPSAETDFGGPPTDGCPMKKSERDATASGNSDGCVSGSASPASAGGGGVAEQVPPTELMFLLRVARGN